MSGWSVPGLAVWGGRPVVRRCADTAPRHRAVLNGTVQSIEVHRALDGTPSFDAVLADGTGSVVVRWLGRRAVAGVEPGSRLTVEGTVLAHRGRLMILNPLFQHGSPVGGLQAAGSAACSPGGTSAGLHRSAGSARRGEPTDTGYGWVVPGGSPGTVPPGGGRLGPGSSAGGPPGAVPPGEGRSGTVARPGGQSAAARGGTGLSGPDGSVAGDDWSVSSASW